MSLRNQIIGAALALILTAGAPLKTSAQDTPTKPQVVPVFTLKGPVTEKPVGDDALFAFSSSTGESLKDLVARIRKAAKDDSVKGVVVFYIDSAMGWAQLEEVRGALDDLKKAGKKVHVHADSLTTGKLALLAGASSLSVVPTGDLMIMGTYGEAPYIRGLLERMGVTPDFLTCGDYKSAGEMFTRTGPSPEDERMTNWLLDGVYDNYIELIATGRNVDSKTVKGWIDSGLYTAEKAKEAGIIDAVQHRQDFVAGLKKEYGDDVKFDKKYGKKKPMTIDMSSPFGVFQFWGELLAGPKSRVSTKDSVAIVYLEGMIVAGESGGSPFGDSGTAYSTPIRKALDKVAEDDTIKAVVFRIDSGGGSAVASEIILDATRRVKAKKPFVVSMGNVAGSGGYYVACGTDTIFAEPSTITGSIGVITGKFATTDMWNKVGINWKSYARGENAGILGSESVFSEEERNQVQSWMDEIYGVFKGHVVSSRGDRLKKEIDELAGGRVYTGRQALELGLVDKLGGLYDAIEFAAKEADLDEYEVRVVPRPKNIMELLFADLAGESDDDNQLSLATQSLIQKRSHSLIDAALPYLKGLDPHRTKGVLQALQLLGMFEKERVMMTMPIYVFPN